MEITNVGCAAEGKMLRTANSVSGAVAVEADWEAAGASALGFQDFGVQHWLISGS